MSDLDLLPNYLAEISISQEEIVLPVTEAIEAINILEAQGYLILGWEGWIKTSSSIGHENTLQGTISLEHLSVSDAAQLCRETIKVDNQKWLRVNQNTEDKLYICISVRT